MSKGYFRTEDKNVGRWNELIIRHVPGINSKIVCAGLCQVEPKCNSFKLKDDNCTLTGPIVRLEEFIENINNQKLYEPFYLEDTGNPYPKNCHGGDNCCNINNTCSWYTREVDCDTDDDCFGSLKCGEGNGFDNNCDTTLGYGSDWDCCYDADKGKTLS